MGGEDCLPQKLAELCLVFTGEAIFLLIKWLIFTIYRQSLPARSQSRAEHSGVSHQLPAVITGMGSAVDTVSWAGALLNNGLLGHLPRLRENCVFGLL